MVSVGVVFLVVSSAKSAKSPLGVVAEFWLLLIVLSVFGSVVVSTSVSGLVTLPSSGLAAAVLPSCSSASGLVTLPVSGLVASLSSCLSVSSLVGFVGDEGRY